MQAIKRSDLPPTVADELEGYGFCILSAGPWPKIIDKDNDPIALGARQNGIALTRAGFDPHTGAPVTVAKTAGELSAEIGNVDIAGQAMYRLDE